ncbi:patatin-like phospholipase family protein [Marinoscillum furvescens]|nr:patatin-like phospholipase family protein [Marinoscillum furvescens]
MRRNLALVILWVLFVVTISGGIGKIYGIHYLYLDPEYVNQVGFWSFFMVGLAFGNFTMAFHITCYILDSHRFTFVGILERPFAKFSINNSVLPLIALITYVVLLIRFQSSNEFASSVNILLDVVGLLCGLAVMLAVFFIYFKFTNKDIFKYLAGSVDKRLRKSSLSRERMMNKLTESRARRYKVYSYFDLKLRVRSCRRLQDFYDKEAVLKVFDQNHFNSVVIEFGVIFLILFLGTFMDNEYLQIPAAASSLLMFSIVIMLVGAFSYWLRGWGLVSAVGLFLLANLLVKWGLIQGEYPARGLDYEGERVNYTLGKLRELNSEQCFREDSLQMLKTLESWRQQQVEPNPRAVFLCVSGGGQRAALWSLNALVNVDSILQGQLMRQTVLITGASGGMVGAAYFRELYWRKVQGEKIPAVSERLRMIGRDNLNPIVFSLLVNDAFFRVRRYTYDQKSYLKDRGYVFEENLNRNLGGVLDKKLAAYREPEMKAQIPMMLMSPVISNDGRKLYISPQRVSFMGKSTTGDPDGKIAGVGFNRLFEKQGAENLNFLTALRMSASFPYITPTVSLPSEPRIEVMDAGISDNFGVGDAVRFIEVFKEWFEENTAGVTMVIIRDTRKNAPIEPQSNPSLIQRMTYPIASVYNNLGNIQDVNNDERIASLKDNLRVPLQTVELEYNTYTNIDESYLVEAKETERKQLERASLSWHLTTKEKENIIQNIDLENNQWALRRLETIMKEGE